MGPELPAKKDVARGLLLRGSVLVHLDPRVAGASVPKWLSQGPQVVLQVGLDLPVPIPDLRIDDQGISGTLSFNRAPFPCVVPWEAVFGLASEDGKGMVWPESMPEEIRAEIDGRATATPPLQLVPNKKADTASKRSDGLQTPSALPQPMLAEVEAETPALKPVPKEKSKKRELPPYLKVIK